MAKTQGKAANNESPLAEKSLQQIAHCLAYLVLQTDSLKDRSNKELIPILASFCFDRSSIASILQTTPETVSVRMSQIKTKSESTSTKKKQKNPENSAE